MRSFYLIVAMAVLLPLSLISKPVSNVKSLQETPQVMDVMYKNGISIDEVVKIQSMNKDNDIPTPQSAYGVLETNQDFFWTGMQEGRSPFAYEPNSNTLIYVTTGGERYGDNRAAYTAHVYLHFSQDGGKTWTKTKVYEKDASLAMLPSVAVLNPNNETDPEKFKIVIAYSFYTAQPRPENPLDTAFYPTGNNYIYFNGQDGWSGALDFPEMGPSKNNPGGAQEWSWIKRKMYAVSSPKGDHFFVYGMLAPQEGYQYGAYGLAYIDFSESDADPNSQIPPQWDLNAFPIADNLGSSYNAPMRISADEEGNLYAMVFNIFDAGTLNRVPAFSKSTDNGYTWSEFQQMPFSLLDDFLSNWNYNPALGYAPYPFSTWDAVVTGVDEFSMFIRLLSLVGPSQSDAVGTGHIVEITYKNGNWQPVKRITEYYGNPLAITNVGNPIPKDTIVSSYRYNEIEVAKTADNKSLVLKFVDYDESGNVGVLNNRVTLVGNPDFYFDSLNTPDVYIAYRNINEDNWTIKNATQDKWYNRGTYMPYIVPSLSAIPIAEYVSGEVNDAENPRNAYPLYVTNLIQDRDGSLPSPPLNTLLIGTFDFNNPSTIKNSTYQNPKGLVGISVLEKLPFALNSIAPNPANDATTLSFTLDYNANVVVNIHNAMGQIVKTVYNGFANEGVNTLNILTNDMPAGAYFYTINVDGKTQTKLLNVVR